MNNDITYEDLIEGLPKRVEYNGRIYELSLELQEDDGEHWFCFFYSHELGWLKMNASDKCIGKARKQVLDFLEENKDRVKAIKEQIAYNDDDVCLDANDMYND